MDILYKEIPVSDREQLLSLIEITMENLERPEFFIPFEPWELERMFDKTYAILNGAYFNSELIGMAQIYTEKQIITTVKRELSVDKKILLN